MVFKRKFLELRIIVIYCLVLNCGFTFAQQGDKHFRNISVEKGLSQSTVFSIKQDSLGFIWVATQDGLNKYNGKSFKVYKPIKNQYNSLQSYYIHSLFIDSKGQLWIGGNNGISRYDYATDTFQNFQVPRRKGEWYISSICEDQEHNMWAASIAGDIFYLPPNQSKFIQVHFKPANSTIKNIGYIGIWQKQLLLGTDNGLFKMDCITHGFSKIDLQINKPNINDVYQDGDFLWVATEGNGLLKFDTKNNKTIVYKHNSAKNSIADNNVRSLEKDDDGNLWIGTFYGLSILNLQKDSFENYYHQISEPYSISQNSVRCVFQDKQKGIWLGTYYGGLNYYYKNDIKFNLLNQNTGSLSLNDQVISAIKEDSKGNFWIGTNDMGLNYWNRQKNTIIYFPHKDNDPNSISSNNIKAIAFDSLGNILIGMHNGGLNILNPQTKSIKHFWHDDNNPQSIAGNLVYSLLRDYKNRIWVGTRSGLDLYEPQTQTFSHVHFDKAGNRINSDDITYLFEDSKHRIWIGTSTGLSLLNPDTFLFEKINGSGLNEDIVNCIVEDNKHRIWVGTRGGLNLFMEASKSFLTFKTQKYFLQGDIYGIEPGNDDNLWISTNTGLVRFNPDKESLQSFDEDDGLPNNQFNEYAFCKARDGLLLFGGIKGITYFYPLGIQQQLLSLKIKLTGLDVFNKAVTINDETHILSAPINQVSELKFSAEYKQFSIYFNTFNYISANRTHYFYKLDGFDAAWRPTDELKATYNNLRSGTYHFFVKAIGPNGETSPVRSLKIIVLPPWYKTFWFFLGVFLIITIGAYVAYRIISERIKALNLLKKERIEKEKVRYINQIKTDFFTNVSHELRTPLTLILVPLEELLASTITSKQLKSKYQLMYGNAKRLYHLVDQLFEFKKTELNIRQLRVIYADMVKFAEEMYLSFKPLAEKKHIHYTISSTENTLSFEFDKDAMERILFNLLSNAFKYTKDGGSVTIELSTKDEHALIKISDTGIGIAKEVLSKIFDRFYQVNNEETNLGSGVGLSFTKRLIELHHGNIAVESEPGAGTSFIVSIPMATNFYVNDTHSTTHAQEPLQVNDESNINEAHLDLNENEALQKELKLLVVDDNQDILNYLKDYFNKKYEVIVAEDGKEALEVLENNAIDLIISDVMMPEMDGLHFCKRVKQNINTSHIPLILLTAKTETSQQIKGLEMGADDYIAKPFSITLLEIKIKNIFNSRKRLKEYYAENKEIIPESIASNPLDEEFIKQSISIIEEHLLDINFSVDKFSRIIGMSRSNLYLKLKAITGQSANDFIKRIRFKKAVELMQSKKYSIAEIAYMCGFNSPSYFSTAFKKHFGCMPSEYSEKNDLI